MSDLELAVSAIIVVERLVKRPSDRDRSAAAGGWAAAHALIPA
jgi:hypothetical protein